MVVDPVSVLVGVPVLGPIVYWLLRELKEVRKWMERFVQDESVAKAQLAAAMTRLADAVDKRAQIDEQLHEALVVKKRPGDNPD